jgi:hypothetical protein
MQLWSRLRSLARNLLRKPAMESELNEELQSYTDTLIGSAAEPSFASCKSIILNKSNH